MTAPASTTEARRIRCPRCGYDQRGLVATWSDSCPLQGICTECGLEFAWCDVLVPQKFEPRWCVEFTPRLLGVPWAACKTFARSFWPWGFWKRLQMSHRIRWLRLAMYGLLIPILLILPLYVIAQTTLALQARSVIQQSLVQSTLNRPVLIQSLQQQKQNFLAYAASAGYSPEQIAVTVNQIDAQIAQLQGAFNPYIDSSALATTIEALIFPLADKSSASIVLGAGTTQPYLAPVHLLAYSRQLSSWPGNAPEAFRLSMAWLAWGVGMFVLLPLSLALLPFSLRKAKVRWVHIVRVTAYGMIIPVLLLAMGGFTLGLAAFQSAPLVSPTSPMLRVVPWLAVALWWHAAVGRYMKIPHAWLTIGMLTLMCLLVLLALTAMVSEPLAWDMMDLFGPLIR